MAMVFPQCRLYGNLGARIPTVVDDDIDEEAARTVPRECTRSHEKLPIRIEVMLSLPKGGGGGRHGGEREVRTATNPRRRRGTLTAALLRRPGHRCGSHLHQHPVTTEQIAEL